MIKEIYVVNVLGAPSPTAVIVTKDNISIIDWKKTAYDVYYFLKMKNINFSKMAIIKLNQRNTYDFKFIQLKKRNDVIQLETNVNCGNSMIAASRVIYKLQEEQQQYDNTISLTNIDTKLEVSIEKNENILNLYFKSLIGKNINDAKIFEDSERITIQEYFGNIKISIIDIVAPYIITNAKNFGIDSSEKLLGLNESNVDILEKVKKLREDVVKKYNFDENSEFPKIALVLNDGKKLSARTIYLDSWHKGLPLTGAITIKLASKIKGSVVYEENMLENEILTTKGPKKVNIKIDDNGIILDCSILNIKSSNISYKYDYNE